MIHSRDLISGYLDDELPAEERALVAAHIGECTACADELEGIGRVRGWLRSLPEEEPPVPLVPAARRSTRRVAVAVSVAAAAMIAAFVVVPPHPEVLDLQTLAQQHTARVVVVPGISSIRGPVGGP